MTQGDTPDCYPKDQQAGTLGNRTGNELII